MLRVLKKAKVIYVSNMADEVVEQMHMTPAKSLADAVAMAKQIVNKADASIVAIPDGVSVIVV